MRPKSIVLFDRLFLTSIFIGLVQSALNFTGIKAMAGAENMGNGVVLGIIAFSIGIPLLLWFFIARKASNIAKWILVVMTALGLLVMPSTFRAMPTMSVQMVTTLLVTVLQLVAIYFLFRADARGWLESKGREGPADPADFD